MDQRLKDFADLVARLLAQKWYRLQQEKKRPPGAGPPTGSKHSTAVIPPTSFHIMYGLPTAPPARVPPFCVSIVYVLLSLEGPVPSSLLP